MKPNLKHYSALATAFIAMKSESDAQIVYTDIKDTTITVEYFNRGESYNLDLNGDGIADFQITNYDLYTGRGADVTLASTAYILPLNNNEVVRSGNLVSNFNCGSHINDKRLWGKGRLVFLHYRTAIECSSSADDCGNTYRSHDGNWKHGKDWFCAVRLIDHGDTTYGWIRLAVKNNFSLLETTIKDYAFEATPGKSIDAGQMPCDSEKAVLPDEISACLVNGVYLTDDKSPCFNWQWYKNGIPIDTATGNSLFVDSTGNYFVVSHGGDGCADTSTISHVTIHQNPEKPIITQRNDTLFSDSGPFYQWEKIYSAISPINSYNWIIPPDYSCYYQVIASDSGGCSATSDFYAYANSETLDSNLYLNSSGTITDIAFDTLKICNSNTVILLVDGEFLNCTAAFQWVRNGVDIPFATQETYIADSDGVYYCKMQGYNRVFNSYPASIDFVPSITSVITRLGDTLRAPAGYNYQWYKNVDEITGATSPYYIPIENGSYSVKIDLNSFCESMSPPFVFGSCSLENKSLNFKDSAILCNGKPFELIASDQNDKASYSFQWFKNDSLIQQATDSTYSVNSPGKYYCEISGYDVVCNTDSVNAEEYPIPAITQKQDTLISSPGIHYQWLLNGGDIIGATSREYVYRRSGSYAVVVEVANTCDLTSNPVQVVYTAVANITEDEVPKVFFIQPKLLGVKFSNQDFLHGKIKIINALGQTVREVSIESNVVEIPFSEDESGWFVLDIEKDEHRYFSPVVIF